MFFIFLCCCNLKDEDKTHISELFNKMMPKLVNYSEARLNDPSYAGDIVQVAFVILIEKYDNLIHEDLTCWAFKVVDNLIKNKNRVENNRESIVSTVSIEDLKDEKAFCYDQLFHVRDIILRELSETESDIFNTYFILCEPHEVAAKKYNISINASKARKCRIRARLIQILKENSIAPKDDTSK